jgi:hypothetical protein
MDLGGETRPASGSKPARIRSERNDIISAPSFSPYQINERHSNPFYLALLNPRRTAATPPGPQ